MWELKKNYPREEEDMKCSLCNGKEDTAEHVLECQTAETVYRIKNNTPNQGRSSKGLQKQKRLLLLLLLSS